MVAGPVSNKNCGIVFRYFSFARLGTTRLGASAVAEKRNDASLEQIVGRLSLEPHVTAASWQVDRTISEE
ncbi:hypothetical protein [Hyphomicrobium facile]|uniref:hypothetical protein n=1 Tax=Hyphomicrobium facile TaxID=51670 RepID=UPI0031397FC6